MSNATLPQLLSFNGDLSIPSHSMIVVNPITTSTNGSIDADWNDLLITDDSKGVKSLLPFTSIDKSNGLLAVESVTSNYKSTGERRLTCTLPFNWYDTTLFDVKDQEITDASGNKVTKTVLTTKEGKELDEKLKEFTTEVESQYKQLQASKSDYTKVAEKYSAVADKIVEISEYEKVAEGAEAYVDELQKKYGVAGDLQDKLTDIYKDIAELNIDAQVESLTTQIEALKNEINEEWVQKVEELKATYNVEDLKEFEETYKTYKDTTLPQLLENTQQVLHDYYTELRQSLSDCVDNNLIPLLDAQVSACLQDEKVSELVDLAVSSKVDSALDPNNSDSEFARGVNNIVATAISGDSVNKETNSEAKTALKEKVQKLIKDEVDSNANVQTALANSTPEVLDARYLERSTQTYGSTTCEVITLSSDLRTFLTRLGYDVTGINASQASGKVTPSISQAYIKSL
jgi:hypothetical protein